MASDATLRILIEAEGEAKPGVQPTAPPPPPAAPAPGSGADLRQNNLLDDVFRPRLTPEAQSPIPAFAAFGARFQPPPGQFDSPPPAPVIPTGQRFPGQQTPAPVTAFGATQAPPIPVAQPLPTGIMMADPARTLENLLAGRLGMDSLRTAGYAATSFATGGTQTLAGLTSGGMALASTGLLGEGAAAVAGGPAGILAVIGAKLGDVFIGEIQKGFTQARQSIEQIPGITREVFNNQPLALFNRQVENAAKGLEQIPVVGGLLAEQFRLAAAPLKAFSETLTVIAERGKELSGLSSPIATATANQEVARIQADIREANRLGPDYARVINLQTGFEQEGRELLLPIKELLAKLIADVGEPILEVVKTLRPILSETAGAVDSAYTVGKVTAEVLWENAPVLREIRLILTVIKERLGLNSGERDADSALVQLLNLADRHFEPGKGFDAPDPQAAIVNGILGNLGLPGFARNKGG